MLACIYDNSVIFRHRSVIRLSSCQPDHAFQVLNYDQSDHHAIATSIPSSSFYERYVIQSPRRLHVTTSMVNFAKQVNLQEYFAQNIIYLKAEKCKTLNFFKKIGLS